MTVALVFKVLEMLEDDKNALRNHGGGHLNHSFFWSILGPKKQIDQVLAEQIEKQFTSIEKFKNEFDRGAQFSRLARKYFAG